MRRVLLRITPGIEADTHEKISTGHAGSKFGVAPEQAPAIVERARAAGLELLGLHVHLGSQLPARRRRLAIELLAGSAHGAGRARLDAGDPRPRRRSRHPLRRPTSPLRPRLRTTRARCSERLHEAWSAARLPQPQLVFEPGRSLVGRAGVTLYRVGVVKRSASTTWVAVDGGMSDNPRPALYGAKYSALLANRADEPPEGAYAVCGKHCESGDVLIERAELPKPRRGDLLAVAATGAYTLAMASNYNARAATGGRSRRERPDCDDLGAIRTRRARWVRVRLGPSPAARITTIDC